MYANKPLLHERQRAHAPGMLRTIALDVTTRCNMKCPHCYAETFAHREPAPLEALSQGLAEAYELGVHHYVLQGGEPITDMDRLEGIIAMIRPEETYINVVSNGWAMSPAIIARLKDMQVDKIAFSLDSGIEAEHDSGRGAGAFQRVLQALDDVLSAGLLTSISTVVTRESLYSQGFKESLDFALHKGIRLDVQIAMPVGKWDGRKDLLMRPEDSAYIKKLQLECPTLKNGQRLINRDIYNFGGRDHCPAGVEFMAITADNNVLPCNFCQFTLGRVGEKSLKKMRADLIANRWFNGTNPRCLLGEDDDFFETYVKPNVDAAKPMDAYALFGL